MKLVRLFAIVLVAAAGCASGPGQAAQPQEVPSDGGARPPSSQAAGEVGVVSLVSVTSDRVADVSSLQAWQRSFIHDGMSDQEKAEAVWRSVVAFRQQDTPAEEFMDDSTHPHDPIKIFNVYGYAQCDCDSAAIAALARSVGLAARGRELREHSVEEVAWGGAWHMLDAAYINQFPMPDGTIAGVDDLIAQVSGWLAAHPGYQGDFARLDGLRASGGWRQGPPLLAACPYYDANGLFPAGVQGWPDTMISYDGTANAVFEYGYTLGYRVNVQLRKGERLTRNWSNQRRTVNDDLGIPCATAHGVVGKGDLRWSPAYGDLAPGRVGNGTLAWEVPLALDDLEAAARSVDNLAQAGGGVTPASADRPGVLVVRMPSSYVYLDGAATIDATVGAGGRIVVSFSENHGLDWTKVATLDRSGTRAIDLSSLVHRRYDYLLQVELDGSGTTLGRLALTHTIQYSQRALPALAQGDNHITFTAGPPEGTLTIEGSTDPNEHRNLDLAEFHPALDGISPNPIQLAVPSGSITFPLTTPGDLVRLRFGAHYRARDAGDGWDFQVSFDGTHFQTVFDAAGPTAGDSHYLTFTDVPPGTRRAWVRFAGRQKTATMIFGLRIDADYREPHGGFLPVKVTYLWDESGQPKSDVHVARSPEDHWVIHCEAPPALRALIVEPAQ